MYSPYEGQILKKGCIDSYPFFFDPLNRIGVEWIISLGNLNTRYLPPFVENLKNQNLYLIMLLKRRAYVRPSWIVQKFYPRFRPLFDSKKTAKWKEKNENDCQKSARIVKVDKIKNKSVAGDFAYKLEENITLQTQSIFPYRRRTRKRKYGHNNSTRNQVDRKWNAKNWKLDSILQRK